MSFTSSASGIPTPTVRWQVQTGGSGAFTDLANGGPYSGVTTNTLTITNPTVSLSTNQYRAVFTNTCGGTATATSNPATLTVNRRVVTPSITAANKAYDGTTTASVTGSLSNVVAGDDVTLSIGAANFSDKNVGNGKTVTATGLSLSGSSAGNYVLSTSTATTTANITPRVLTGVFTVANKVYDGTTTATVLTRSLSGVVGSEDVRLTGGTAAFNDANAGNGKTVTLTGATLSGTDAGNYSLAVPVTTTANILPRLLTITADPKTKTVGTADPPLTFQITSGSLAPGDSITGSLRRVTGETVGNYPILQGSLTPGPNYAVTYNGANLTITDPNAPGTGLEGDINRVPFGTGSVAGPGDNRVNGLDLLQYDRFQAGGDTPSTGAGGEFQRMDTAEVPGDGCIKPNDKQQIANYIAGGSTTWIAAAGPTSQGLCPIPLTSPEIESLALIVAETERLAAARELRIMSATFRAGGIHEIKLALDSQSNERVLQFSLDFDPSMLEFVGELGIGVNENIAAGAGAPTGTIVTANTEAAELGRISIVIDAPTAFEGGVREAVKIAFRVKPSATGRKTDVTFSDTPTVRFITFADSTGTSYGAKYIGGTVTVTDQAAPSVEVSGKVLTPDGRGLRNTQVTITDKYGVARTVTTSSFGTFRFDAVTPGETYTLAVTSKRYRFASRQVTITDNLSNIVFTGKE